MEGLSPLLRAPARLVLSPVPPTTWPSCSGGDCAAPRPASRAQPGLPAQWPPVATAPLTFDHGCRRQAPAGLRQPAEPWETATHLFKPPSSEGTCYGLTDDGSRDSGLDPLLCSGPIFASAKKRKKTDLLDRPKEKTFVKSNQTCQVLSVITAFVSLASPFSYFWFMNISHFFH